MQIAAYHSHLNGYEWLLVHRKHLWKEIQSVVSAIEAEGLRTKISLEKRKKSTKLYSPKALNKKFKTLLDSNGWQEVRTDYWVTDDYNLIRQTVTLAADEQKRKIKEAGKTPISSYNQTDFEKERVAIEVQFGKYSFIDYDLFVKHLAFYVGDKIDVGIEILPMKSMQQEMSSGIGYYERALYDVARQGRGVPAVPLVLIGIVA